MMITLLLALANASSVSFEDWMVQYNRTYSSPEYQERFQYFHENLKRIEALESATPLAKYSPDDMTDWSPAELLSTRAASKPFYKDAQNQERFTEASFVRLLLASLGKLRFGVGRGACRSMFSVHLKNGKGHKLRTYFLIQNPLIDKKPTSRETELSLIL